MNVWPAFSIFQVRWRVPALIVVPNDIREFELNPLGPEGVSELPLESVGFALPDDILQVLPDGVMR